MSGLGPWPSSLGRVLGALSGYRSGATWSHSPLWPWAFAVVCALAATVSADAQSSLPPEPTPTPEVIQVGDTTYQLIYLYHSPTTGDRIESYPEGTPLVIIGTDVEGDGLTWHNVRAPDGTEGYIPAGDTVSPLPPD